MKIEKVKSLGEYVSKVSELRDAWKTRDDRELWFRGESKIRPTSLQPTLYRPRKNPDIEGAFLPMKPISRLLKIELALYEEFCRRAVQLCDEKINEDDWEWDSYFLMQHHNAPTRLLDWSDGSLMGLHFATSGKDRDDKSDAIVYVLEPYKLMKRMDALPQRKAAKNAWADYVAKHPKADLTKGSWDENYLPSDRKIKLPSLPVLLEFPHFTRRVAAQRSRFMLFGTSHDWLTKEAEHETSPIRGIAIDAGSIPKIRRDLREGGITEAVIFPDLDGLGRELKQLWEEQI
jgi:hypothetical protein